MYSFFTSRFCILLVLTLCFSVIQENVSAQSITVSGLTGSCSGANGTYNGPLFSLPLWGKTTGLNQYYIDKSGSNWQIRLDGGAVYAISPITNPNVPPCGPWTSVGGCGGTAVLNGGCQAASASCSINLTSGPLSQTLCTGVPITPLVFSTTIATNVSTGNMPPGVSAIFTGNATAGTITVSGTPTSIPTGYNPSLFVTAIGGTCTGINTVNFTVNLLQSPSITGPTVVNVGSSVSLTGSGTPSGTPWTINNANATINGSGLVSGVNAGNSIVTYTASNNCTATQNLTIATGPTASVLSSGTGPDNFCSSTSGSANLAINITGGTSPFTVVVTDGTTNYTTTGYMSGADISVSPAVTSTYSIVSITDANSFAGSGNSGSATVTVNPTPMAPIANPAVVCPGDDVTLLATGSTTGYNWYTDSLSTTVISNSDSLALTNVIADTTFYVETYGLVNETVGPVDNTIGTGANFSALTAQQLIFTTNSDIIIDSVTVYPQGPGSISIEAKTSANAVVASTTVNVTASGGNPETVYLGFSIPAGVNYTLGCSANGTTGGLYRNNTSAIYPYTSGSGAVSITGNTFSTGYYYFFYDWKVSVPGCPSARTAVPVTVNNPTITSLTATDTVVCAGGAVTLSVNPGLAGVSVPFCTPTYSNGTGFGDYIDSVGGFGGLLQNQTGASAAPYYQLSPTPIAVTTATPYSVTVRNGTFGSQEQSIWIDYNQDSIFQANEQVGQVNNIAANVLTTFNVNIPSSAYNGITLMRIMDDYNGPIPLMDPCRAASYGETEDYVLNISGGTNTPAPFDSIAWTPSTYLDTTTQATVNALNMLNTTTYSVTGFDAAGCSVSDSITITVNPAPVGNIFTDPIVISSLPYVDSNTNLSANCWSDQGTHTGNRAGNDVFYQFVMPGCSDSIEATLCNTVNSWDTWMHLLDSAGATITQNDDDCGLRSTINWGGLVKGATYYIVVDGIGATNQDSFIVNIDAYEPVVASSLAQTSFTQSMMQGDGSSINYYDNNCELIANINDGAGGNVLGTTFAGVAVGGAQTHNGQPFAGRWYQITPTSNGPADVTLYFTQADFDDLNAATVAPYLQLPTTGSNTDPNIPNIRITKNDDAGLTNNPIVLTPTSVNWNGSYWEVTVATPSFSQFRAHAVNPNNTALPVRYTNFTVRKERTVDVVEWTTANEQNNKLFNVQRSANGNDFTTLGTVETKAQNGNSAGELSYSFVDQKPMTGHNYYRLEQVDIDNKTNFSEVIDIVWGTSGSIVSIYPNPATHVLNIDLTSSQAAQTEVKLVDMSGRVVNSLSMKTTKGLNHMTLNLGEVATGVYGVQIFENNKLTNVAKIRKN